MKLTPEQRAKLLGWLEREYADGLVDAWGDRHQQHDAPHAYEDTPSYSVAAHWLEGHGRVADWGCGAGYARQFLGQDYVGIDGTPSKWADLVADLRTCQLVTPCIFSRHALEHNFRWREVLQNLLDRFTHRAALVTFIAHGESDQVTRWDDFVPYISFDSRSFNGLVAPCLKDKVEVVSHGLHEAVWMLEKPTGCL